MKIIRCFHKRKMMVITHDFLRGKQHLGISFSPDIYVDRNGLNVVMKF